MSDEDWRPGPRPAWVRSLHAATDPDWIRLDPDELLDEAVRRSGLSDFGGDAFLEPFRLFVKALAEEAKLHPIGRILARGDLRNWLENRLRLAEARKTRPEIAREEVRAPIFITGLPRTGTSILHELLAQDPAHRAPLHWEVRSPCPPPEAASFETDARIALAEEELQLWNQVVPEYAAMHELGARLPVECIQITAHEFRSDELSGRHQVPSYAVWLARADLAPAYAFHRRFLQHLQSRCPRERWVLKAPSHLGALASLFGEYPDARVVVTHRDPLKVLPSVASILYSTAWVRSDAVDAQAVLGWFTPETCLALLGAMSGLRDAGAVPADRFCDVRYADLMARPIETLAAVYDHFGIPLGAEAEARVRAYLAGKPRHKLGVHRYAFENTGRERARERERFRGYQERYGVPSEA
ncbi:MAG TPA: sulfotransferase [Myxococcota bacterium]